MSPGVRMYDVRFIMRIHVRPDDLIVPEGSQEYFKYRYQIERTLRRTRQVIRRGIRHDLDECRAFASDLAVQAWTPYRCICVKRPVN